MEQSNLKPCIPSELNPPLNYTLVTDVAGLEKVAAFFKRKSVFAIDTETNMVEDFYLRRIRTIQIGDREEQYVIDLKSFTDTYAYTEIQQFTLMEAMGNYTFHSCLLPVVSVLRPVLESKDWLKVGHNLQFDYEVLKWCFGLRMWNVYDTMLAEMVIYAGRVDFNIRGFWGLKDCVARYAGLEIDKDAQTSFNLTDELTENQKIYCALDCRLPLAVKSGQNAHITKGNLWQTCQLEFDAMPAFADMHLNGIRLDTEAWRGILAKVEADHQRNVQKLDEYFIPLVGKKGECSEDLVELENIWKTTTDKELRAEARKRFMTARKQMNKSKKEFFSYEGDAAINYGSNPQLLAALRKKGYDKKELPDTNDRTLKKISEHPKWDLAKAKKESPDYSQVGIIDAIRLYRETNKILTTYGENFIRDYINENTGRIHSRIKQMGAETGRTSSVDPNIQNIPRGSDWRGCFIPRDGWKMITVDYNGCELRILAEYSREKAFLDAFLQDWDVHSVGAEILFGDEWKNAAEEGCAYYSKHQKCKCKGHKELRDAVKALNFGIAYGMEAKKLAEAIDRDEAYAEVLLKKYRATFPTLIKYLEASAKSAVTKLESRTLANRRRYFRKPEWADAVKKAVDELRARAKKEGRDTFDPPSTKKIAQKYKAMFMAIEREGKNTPIQGSNADLAKIAMGCGFDSTGVGFMWHRLEPEFGAKLVNFVHDEFVIEVEPDRAEECFKFVGDCMERSGKVLIKLIPMTYEGHIGDRWQK
jgi:DNA polymerase I-like protein with 3'-5' exonuclease and polymerase domains